MSLQLLVKFRGAINPKNPSLLHNRSPIDRLSIDQRLRGYGISGFRPAGLPDAWSEVDEPWEVS